MAKTLRLILGDQLNINHSWFSIKDESVTYVIMEIRTETDYVRHHIQKVVGFFAAMRNFGEKLKTQGHKLIYLKLNDLENLQDFEKNCNFLIEKLNIEHFEYQLADEYRVDENLKKLCHNLKISSKAYDSEHFYGTREELANFFHGKKTYIMENFYRYMRKKHDVLMSNNEPETGIWNYDSSNRKKITSNHRISEPYLFENDLNEIYSEIKNSGIQTLGTIDENNFLWPIDRNQSLELLNHFVSECLTFFGTFQDAMTPNSWSIYHSRLSFSLNLKLISPAEVIEKVIAHYRENQQIIGFNQVEGFVRQIIGWREYMRGIYWAKMPEFSQLNYFEHHEKLPDWFWSGETNLACLKHSIKQSLEFSYAHHIQRLMVTGNFALLTGIDPDELDLWYLGIYIDAIEWVEITNTRGMSQFADGGIVGTKPYVSSASYIDKMSDYCKNCYYDKTKKIGDKACPFNSLYWNFYDKHENKLAKNPRISMMYSVWRKMDAKVKADIINQANTYLQTINSL
jgi:deoxyribodipyrimidine photolyase-related protein